MQKFLLIALAASCAMPAFATTVVYTDKAAFLAATGATQNLFSSSDDGVQGSTYTLGTVTWSTPTYFYRYDDAYGAPNTPYLGGYGAPITITSTSKAVGFDFGSYGGTQDVTYSIDGLIGTFSAPSPNSTAFIGFLGDLPLNLSLSNNEELDTIATYTSDATASVPEPASWAMMVGGFGLLGAALRRKRLAVSFG